jgi:hypothetical protein
MGSVSESVDRARFRVPGCSEVSQPGLPSCLVGCRYSSMKELMMGGI